MLVQFTMPYILSNIASYYILITTKTRYVFGEHLYYVYIIYTTEALLQKIGVDYYGLILTPCRNNLHICKAHHQFHIYSILVLSYFSITSSIIKKNQQKIADFCTCTAY